VIAAIDRGSGYLTAAIDRVARYEHPSTVLDRSLHDRRCLGASLNA
jgi:hypothetical protein